MNVDIEISHIYEAFVSALFSNAFDSVIALINDMEQKNATEYVLHLETVEASGLTDALSIIEDLSSDDCLTQFTMLPKEANIATSQMFSATTLMLHSIASLMIAVQLGNKIVKDLSSSDLAAALAHSLGPSCSGAKFVEVALSEALTAITNVLRLYLWLKIK